MIVKMIRNCVNSGVSGTLMNSIWNLWSPWKRSDGKLLTRRWGSTAGWSEARKWHKISERLLGLCSTYITQTFLVTLCARGVGVSQSVSSSSPAVFVLYHKVSDFGVCARITKMVTCVTLVSQKCPTCSHCSVSNIYVRGILSAQARYPLVSTADAFSLPWCITGPSAAMVGTVGISFMSPSWCTKACALHILTWS